MKMLKRTLLIIGLVVAGSLVGICGFIVAIDAKIRWYDDRYHRIELGQSEAELVTLLGKPDKSVKAYPHNRVVGIEHFYIYRVDRIGQPPVKWDIGFNGKGKIISKHRDANGC